VTESEYSETVDVDLQRWFAQQRETTSAQLDAAAFTRSVTSKATRWRRRQTVLRLLLAIALSSPAVPPQDLAIALSHLLMINLIQIENALAAQLLAPVNTVGSLLSMAVLGLRLLHRRVLH